MIPFLIIFILGLIFTILLTWDEAADHPYGSPGVVFFGGLVVTTLAAFFVSLIIGGIVYNGHDIRQPRQQLMNIVDNTTTHGTFFLGSGSVDGVPQYSWYAQTAKNSYERQDVDASMSTIHFVTKGSTPYYVRTVKHYGPFIQKWGLDLGAGDDYDTHYDFYVPPGTITRDYTLDAR